MLFGAGFIWKVGFRPAPSGRMGICGAVNLALKRQAIQIPPLRGGVAVWRMKGASTDGLATTAETSI